MAGYDYDVLIIGSGFGGSVSALRAAEKGYRVGVMESGKRWKDEDIPKTQWDLPGLPVVPGGRALRDPTGRVPRRRARALRRRRGRRLARLRQHAVRPAEEVLRCAGMGAASPTGPTSWHRTSTRRRECSASSATRTCPPTSTASCSRSRPRWGEARRSTRRRWASTSAALASRPTIRTSAESGPRRTGCISCGKCNIGCGHNAKNKLTTNYLYLAEKLGVEVHELHEVYDLVPLDGGGFEVHARHPGWAQRAAHLHHHTYTAEQVIVAAHAYGSSKLLHAHAAQGSPDGPVERARATRADELGAAARDHADARRVEARSGEDQPHARARCRSPRASGRIR